MRNGVKEDEWTERCWADRYERKKTNGSRRKGDRMMSSEASKMK